MWADRSTAKPMHMITVIHRDAVQIDNFQYAMNPSTPKINWFLIDWFKGIGSFDSELRKISNFEHAHWVWYNKFLPILMLTMERTTEQAHLSSQGSSLLLRLTSRRCLVRNSGREKASAPNTERSVYLRLWEGVILPDPRMDNIHGKKSHWIAYTCRRFLASACNYSCDLSECGNSADLSGIETPSAHNSPKSLFVEVSRNFIWLPVFLPTSCPSPTVSFHRQSTANLCIDGSILTN